MMVNAVTILSAVFCVISMISVFIGIYTIYINAHSARNRLFFALAMALAVWSFGFTFALSARSMAESLFWRRFSALGWGTFFSVMLHFFVIFTDHKTRIGKPWRTVLIYLPAAVTLLGFSYFPYLNPGQYRLTLTPLGWINIPCNNVWDWFFVIYYLSFTLCCFLLVWEWMKKEKNKRVRKQAALLLSTFPTVLVAGSVLDIFFNSVFSVKLPQIAPILMLYPAVVIFYLIKKHGLMKPESVDEDTALLSGQIHTTIINYFSNAFLAAAFLYIIAMYLFFKEADLNSVLAFSALLVIMGVIIQGIHRSRAGVKIKGILFGTILALMVPLATLKYIEWGGATVWAFPFILLIITLVFERRFIQISLAVSVLATQILIWVLKPEAPVTIDAVDYVSRLGLFVIAIWFAYYIKKVFISKLNENKNQIASQKLTVEISSDFVGVSEDNIDAKINEALSQLGDFCDADRIYIYLFDATLQRFAFAYSWGGDKAAPMDIADRFSLDDCPGLSEQMASKLLVADADELDEPPKNALKKIIRHPFRSLLALPIIDKGQTVGCFMLDTARKIKIWNDYDINIFRIITNIFGDALAKVKQEKEINFMAFYDYLTRLPNRSLFKDRVNQAINAASHNRKMLAVIFIDLDSFKNVNDTMGHDSGDGLLVSVAGALQKAIRQSDAVCRFGGDEFLIMLNNMDKVTDIVGVTGKLLRIFDNPFIIQGQEFFISVSAGVSVYPSDGMDADTLIKNADTAMYKAKEKGKNQFLLCNGVMKDEVAFKIKLTNSLYRALERSELYLHYQPQINLESNTIVGVEALVRWKHPEMGFIPPGLFIPLAEHTGLINPIGEWVLYTACKQCKTWQAMGLPPIRMAVNVSILQLRNPNLASIVDGILEKTGLDPEYLELEITESTANREAEYIGNVLDCLKELGVRISIDDFGTEYSSLSRLSQMPIDRIKIDKQFVWGIGKSKKERSVVTGIISLGHNLGLKVIAEGVEDESQLSFLNHNQCDEVQGFYFYRPVEAQDIEQILGEERMAI